MIENEDVRISPSFLSSDDADEAYQQILAAAEWHKVVKNVRTGEDQTLTRKMAYVYDERVTYFYDKFALPGMTWFEPLAGISRKLELTFGYRFNSCLLNLYENGRDLIGWHSDKEKQLGDTPVIACVNFGATRRFWFQKKGLQADNRMYHVVGHGDLLIMLPHCQQRWLHAILPEPEVTQPRLSLTYRWVNRDELDKPQEESAV